MFGITNISYPEEKARILVVIKTNMGNDFKKSPLYYEGILYVEIPFAKFNRFSLE